MILKQVVTVWTGFIWLRLGSIAGLLWNDNEVFNSEKDVESADSYVTTSLSRRSLIREESYFSVFKKHFKANIETLHCDTDDANWQRTNTFTFIGLHIYFG
jgi:hypothetical protein